MAGKFIIVDRYRREDIKASHHILFAFGDNMARGGLGGQARECRGEWNTIGIPTKWLPAKTTDAYFTDGDFNKATPIIFIEFSKLVGHLVMGGDVAWPRDGIGTGRAQLAKRAPRIAAFIETWRIYLEEVFQQEGG